MIISSYIEHTVLRQGLSFEDISEGLDLCSDLSLPVLVIPPSFVRQAADLNPLNENISICTVIGFPLGYSTFETKIFEIENALENGADELDLVIDNSLIRHKRWSDFETEISAYRKSCSGKILKIIVETSLLNRNELERIAGILVENQADYIKTSTGFVGEGAQIEDIIFLKENFGDRIKIKASGGIKTRVQALEFIKAGADRIGTSSSKQITENVQTKKMLMLK